MRKINGTVICYGYRKTPFGPVRVIGSVYQGQPKISRVLIAKPGGLANRLVETSYPDAVAASCAEIDAVADHLVALLSGVNIRFSLDLARLDLCTEFQRWVFWRASPYAYGGGATRIGP